MLYPHCHSEKRLRHFNVLQINVGATHLGGCVLDVKMELHAPARLPVETGNNQSEHRMWGEGRWPLDTAKENVIGKGQ